MPTPKFLEPHELPTKVAEDITLLWNTALCHVWGQTDLIAYAGVNETARSLEVGLAGPVDPRTGDRFSHAFPLQEILDDLAEDIYPTGDSARDGAVRAALLAAGETLTEYARWLDPK